MDAIDASSDSLAPNQGRSLRLWPVHAGGSRNEVRQAFLIRKRALAGSIKRSTRVHSAFFLKQLDTQAPTYFIDMLICIYTPANHPTSGKRAEPKESTSESMDLCLPVPILLHNWFDYVIVFSVQE